MPIITLSRECGAGGIEVGSRVAERMRLDFLDTALCDEVARRLQVSGDAVHRWDERREGLVLRLLRAMQAAHPESAAGGVLAEEALHASPDPDRLWRTTREVILEEARRGDAVIVGRGGAFLLAGWQGAFHVRLVAPRDARIRRVMESSGMKPEDASRWVDETDRQRLSFLKHRFGVDALDPLHYALILNTEVLGCELAARLIVHGVAGSAPALDGPPA